MSDSHDPKGPKTTWRSRHDLAAIISESHDGEAAKGPVRIVTVDDEPEITELIEDLLVGEGYEVYKAHTMADGLALLEELRPEVALLDKNLPDGSGVELLRHARERGIDTEAILVTGYANLDSSIECMTLGCYAYILKPFDLGVLLNNAARAAEKCVMSRELAARTQQLESTNARLREAMCELTNKEGELAQSEKMAAMGMVAACVAHEINNPATYARGLAELIKPPAEVLEQVLDAYRTGRPWNQIEGSELGNAVEAACEDLREMPDLIRGGLQRIVEIARDLTAFARLDGEQTGNFEPDQVLDATLRMAALDVGKRATLDVSIDPLPTLRGQSGRLSQVVLNLVGNARDAVCEDVAAPRERRIAVRARQVGDQVVIEVEDNGPGIDASIQAEIFEPFFTTKPEGQGTGLGLSITRDLVHKMGGELSVRSAPGAGATFSVVLPVPADIAEAAEVAVAS